MNVAERDAAYLRWPDQRNCDWECPWPRYCVECHMAAYSAMDQVRRVVAAVAWQTELVRTPWWLS